MPSTSEAITFVSHIPINSTGVFASRLFLLVCTWHPLSERWAFRIILSTSEGIGILAGTRVGVIKKLIFVS